METARAFSELYGARILRKLEFCSPYVFLPPLKAFFLAYFYEVARFIH
jgi:hypothetical protein